MGVEIISSGRRLNSLETNIKARITTTDVNKAKAAHASSTSSQGLEEIQRVFKEDMNIETTPTVTEPAKVKVEVKTEIESTSGGHVDMPTGEELEQLAKKAGAESAAVTAEEKK